VNGRAEPPSQEEKRNMRRNQKGFTLMELMVVIVIVAILAAVAVPLYINYVKDARRTEAKAAIGALSTAMEEFYLKTGDYANDVTDLYPAAPGDPRPTNLDLTTVKEIQLHWEIKIEGGGDDDGYAIVLEGLTDTPYDKLVVRYDYGRGTTGGVITDTEKP
jgi:prepilin-type N-terminal cleavage/methylation domain-containing protein